MIITDLHGDWDAYRRYRDRFVDLQAGGRADYLIFTGDLIHAESSTAADHSLKIVLDVLTLQATYGQAIIYLCGNHELPHIYGFGLAKGAREFTPAFEAALSSGSDRSAVIGLLQSLPFYLRTAAGVSLTHAGAAPGLTDRQSARKLFTWDHLAQLAHVDSILADQDMPTLRRAYAKLSGAESYEVLAQYYLAVEGPDDPRYDDLLRGALVTTKTDFQLLYTALFTKCEQEYDLPKYSKMLAGLLRHLSIDYVPQRVLVAGHMNIRNKGYRIVTPRHLRLASGIHATPRKAARYLLFDTAQPVADIEDLLAGLNTVY
jgi:Icc-related predicted phosphoesterase